MTSCIPYKDLVLFRKDEKPLPNMPATTLSTNPNFIIQPNDALAITVSCIDPTLAAPFNLVDARNSSNVPAESPFASFLVDSNGDIDYPVLGKIQVAKMTIPQLKENLVKRLKTYIKDPTVNIRRVNFRITVLGEVAKPGSFIINSERVTVLEALGLAGDMTPYSDRRRVMVVREQNGKTTFEKLDLQSADFFKSPYYFLQQNDVVYIDPTKNKRGAVVERADKYVNWWSAGLSAISTVVTVLIFLKK